MQPKGNFLKRLFNKGDKPQAILTKETKRKQKLPKSGTKKANNYRFYRHLKDSKRIFQTTS